MYLSDLHIHSRYSRATSKDCDAPHLDWWARCKGIRLLGTGDFTHPAWREELRQQLVPAGEGLYTLREEFRLPGALPGEAPLFLVTGEISSIYKRDGKTRKVHNLILLPSLEAADELSARLEAIGNIRSDGRPILGLDSRDLLELTLDCCPDAELIPAHIWTPHFSMFGAFSGFDSVEACFGDLSGQIHAVETGLSSDPPMNWRVSMLDRMTLVSHSDAHSPAKLGREANLMDTGLSYPQVLRAIRTGEGFLGTVEFFPQEGKYHLDGHRSCGVCLAPAETLARGGVCPVCGKRLTIGVEHRVEELADRPTGYRPARAKPFESLAPLPEVIAASTGVSATSKRTSELYHRLLRELGPEFWVLRQASTQDIGQVAGPCVAEGIRRLRLGQVTLRAGFDGEYGTVSLLTPAEIQQFSGQTSLFALEAPQTAPNGRKARGKIPVKKASPAPKPAQSAPVEELNPRQREAVTAQNPTVAVVAGPGTGKTKTLVARIAYLVEELGVKPGEITAVTFTNQAAAQLRERLQKRLGGKRGVARMTIGTFHSICLGLLGEVTLISQGEALTVAAQLLAEYGEKGSPQRLVQAASRMKNGLPPEEGERAQALCQAYCRRLEELGVLDFDDLITQALRLDTAGRRGFSYLLVDEFQDVSDSQLALVQAWSGDGGKVFAIGDPDQSIYGFRGAGGQCFERLAQLRPDTQVIRLEENYRSTPQILKAALPVIGNNPGGERRLSPNHPSGPAVRLVEAADEFAEGVFIAKEIGRMTGGVDMLEAQELDHEREPRAFSDIAVLCRTHRQLELIEGCLRHDSIPCVVHGREEFLEAPEVRGVLGFLRSLQQPEDTLALENALRLLWSCPEDLVQRACTACRGMKQLDTAALKPAVEGFGHLELWLERVAAWLPLAAAEKPWRLIARWEREFGSSHALERLRNLAVFHNSLGELWNTLLLGQEADLRRAAGKGWESGAVQLMTLHGAKGLEFPAVFVAGVTQGRLPLERPHRPAELEEERRLFYVGMTRAREELVITCGGTSSPFVGELPDSVVRQLPPRRRERMEGQLSLF